MIKKLRPYQQKVVNDILLALKSSSDPILIDASVGSGKSLILSSVLLVLERAGFKALCLTLNSTLIQQNAHTYQLQGGNPGVYCAGLNAKDFEHLVIFASPHSVCKDISNQGNISRQPFRLIIVDECHQINFHNPSSMYMRIINHYSMLAQQEGYNFRIIGLSGTCYRDKAQSIVGPEMLFKSKLCSISTSWLINQGYLVRPEFGLCREDAYDFSQLKVNNMGKFNQKELQAVIDKKERLTGEIMRELQTIKCNGVFIFASTRKHCEECAQSLPDGQWAIITGETKHEDRKRFLESAKIGDIRYLISVGCLNVGVDIPLFDVCAWLRPTESLVLYTQGIGRVLRLHEGKHKAIVLDYASNLQRHGDIDDPIINEALKPTAENEKDYIIPCYTCGTDNTIHARRCIGVVADKRCDHYFQFKDCDACGIANDTTSRACRGCGYELIDPNAKLTKLKVEQFEITVKKAEYWVTKSTEFPVVNVEYETNYGYVFECHHVKTEKSKNIFYANFVRKHIPNPSDYYMRLLDYSAVNEMIKTSKIITPYGLICKKNEYGRYEIVKKLFNVEML
jgi:DNA repair protein RadD